MARTPGPQDPHRTALIHGDTTVSYAELYARTTRLAHALRALGLRRGDRIAYLGPNHPSYLETLFAAGTLGAVFVPLNPRLAGPRDRPPARRLGRQGPRVRACRWPDSSRGCRATCTSGRSSKSAPGTRS